MTTRNSTGKRQLVDLNADELSRIRALNQKLSDAEHWIRERAQQCLAAYYKAGGVKNHHVDPHLSEDVEIEAKVACILREDHPDFKADDDNTMAQLDGSFLVLEVCDEDFSMTNWNELGAGDDHPLTDVHFCYLFHDLFDHILRRDWDRTLAVGGLWIDVSLIQQRMLSWS
jgi:hypothetical protein